MKPVGSFVHLRRGTVNLELVKWLCVGSVPAGFCGVLIARSLGQGSRVEHVIQIALAVALLVAAAGLIVRAYIRLLERARSRDGQGRPLAAGRPQVVVQAAADRHRRRRRRNRRRHDLGRLRLADDHRPDGALPRPGANELVGTDLVQSVPLVASAALGHILFGNFQLSVTAAAHRRGPAGHVHRRAAVVAAARRLIRRALAFVLLASSLKTFGVSSAATRG